MDMVVSEARLETNNPLSASEASKVLIAHPYPTPRLVEATA